MGVFESDLDIYLTNSACVGLRMLGFRFEQGIGIDLSVLQYQYLLHDTKLVSKANLEVSNLTNDAIFWLFYSFSIE